MWVFEQISLVNGENRSIINIISVLLLGRACYNWF